MSFSNAKQEGQSILYPIILSFSDLRILNQAFICIFIEKRKVAR
jgi:hypothetical protein